MELHVGLGRGVILSNHFEGLRALLLDGEIFLRWQFYLALDEDLADKNLADEFVTIVLVLSCIRSRYYVLELDKNIFHVKMLFQMIRTEMVIKAPMASLADADCSSNGFKQYGLSMVSQAISVQAPRVLSSLTSQVLQPSFHERQPSVAFCSLEAIHAVQ